MRIVLGTILLALSLAGCSRDILTRKEPDVIRALWQPDTGVMPTPTDLVRNAEAGLLNLPIEANQSAAEQELRAYFNNLDGYPLSTPISIPFSGELSPQDLERHFHLYDYDTGERLAFDVALNNQATKLAAHAPESGDASLATALAPGHTYVFALVGYADGVHGAHGEPVVADAAFTFVRGEERVTDHAEALPGKTAHEREETALALEEARLELKPYFAFLTEQGVNKNAIATMASFTTTMAPAVVFDPLAGNIPLPNNLLKNRQTNLVELPASSSDADDTRHIKEGLSHYDGFSTTAALIVHSTHKVTTASVTNTQAVRVFRIDDGSFTEATDLLRGVADDGMSFWVRPRLALEHSARYAYVVTDVAEATALGALKAQVFGALLRSKAPLLVNGVSQVVALSDADAAKVEPVRAEMAPLLDHLASLGLLRQTIAAAVPFDTLQAPKLMMGLRQRLYEEEVSTNITDLLIESPWDRGLWAIMSDVETVVTGKMTTLNLLDPLTTAFRPDGSGTPLAVDFVLTIPEGVDDTEALPVVLFAHGLETSRELVYLIANKLANNGYAAFSLDLPFHGNRSVCRRNIECAEGTCGADGTCAFDDGTPGRLRQVSGPWASGPVYPITSGFYFIDATDLFASRDHFLQSALDLLQGLRVIRANNWFAKTGWTLNKVDVTFFGMSLGGILGASIMGVEPLLHDFALNVTGGDLVEMMDTSTVLWPMISPGLSSKGISKGTPKYFEFQNAARWILDVIEPMNLGIDAVQNPGAKRVLIQMADGDLVVPNIGTEHLVERFGMAASVFEPLISNHVFLFDPTSFEGARARNEAMEFLNAR